MLIAAVSRTGHVSLYGPFDNKAIAYMWASDNLVGFSEHDPVKGTINPVGTWQVVHDVIKVEENY